MLDTEGKLAKKEPVRKSFGTGVKRFFSLGLHPKFEVRPGTHKFPDIAPGCYNWNKQEKIVSKVSSWKKELNSEEFSQQLGFHGKHIIKKREWLRSINGPGWQDIPPSFHAKFGTFPKKSRFPQKKKKSFAVPGPGLYGKNHDPYAKFEEKSRSKGFSFSTLPSFEHRSCRTRIVGVYNSSHLPPNIYRLPNSIDQLIAKKVSKRGPYDLFSGERFPNKPVFNSELSPPVLYSFDLNHPKNYFKGKFQKTSKDTRITGRIAISDPAFCLKNPSEPGPNYYNPYLPPKYKQNKFSFNLSVDQIRPYVKSQILPPPGRYNPEFKRRILGNGARSAFITATQRVFIKRDKYSWFE